MSDVFMRYRLMYTYTYIHKRADWCLVYFVLALEKKEMFHDPRYLEIMKQGEIEYGLLVETAKAV